MEANNLAQEIIRLKDEIHGLAGDELDQVGDPQARYAAARQLAEKVNAFKGQLEAVPEKQRRLLQELLRQAEPDLSFLEFSANKAAAGSGQPPSTAEVIRQFSAEVFALAKAMLAGKVPLAEAQQKVREFDAQLKDIAGLPGRDEPELQSLLSEARLELNWIFNGGKGPTSLRLGQLQ